MSKITFLIAIAISAIVIASVMDEATALRRYNRRHEISDNMKAKIEKALERRADTQHGTSWHDLRRNRHKTKRTDLGINDFFNGLLRPVMQVDAPAQGYNWAL